MDFLSVQENVDPERIGIIGICGWGGMAERGGHRHPYQSYRGYDDTT